MISLPVQKRTYPNTNDICIDGVWLQACITCGREGGDCEHTVILCDSCNGEVDNEGFCGSCDRESREGYETWI